MKDTHHQDDYRARGSMFSPVRPLVSFDRRQVPSGVWPQPRRAGFGVRPLSNTEPDPGAAVTSRAAGAGSDRGALSEGIRQFLGSLAGAVAVALLFPIALLILGAPFALAVRLVLAALGWLARLLS